MSPRSLGRLSGLLYLVLAVTSGPVQFFRESLLVPGDPAATAAKVRDAGDALRFALVADLVGIAAFVLMALLLWSLFRTVGPRAAGALLALVVVAATIQAADLANHAAAYLLSSQPASASTDQLTWLFINLHRQGYFVAQVFFGLWLVPFGWLVWRTARLPRVLGLGLMVGGVCYVAALAPVYASASLASELNVLISWPAGIAEIATGIWLAFMGVNVAPIPGRAGAGTPGSSAPASTSAAPAA